MTDKPAVSSLEATHEPAYVGTSSLKGPQPTAFKRQEGDILLIGAGDVVKSMSGPAILEQFNKIYVYDPTVNSPSKLPEGIQPYADRFVFLDSLQEAAQLKNAGKLNVDLAYIASPPKYHAAGMDFCMDNGINFACEKPHFQNPAEAERITNKLAQSSSKGFFLDWMPYKEEVVNQAFGKALFDNIPYPKTVKGAGRLQEAISGGKPFNMHDVAKITHRFTEGGADVLAVRQDTPKGAGSLEDNMVHILAALGVKGVRLDLEDKNNVVTLAQKTDHTGIYKPIGNNDNTTGENYAHFRGKSTSGTDLDLLVAKFGEEGRDEWKTTYEFKDGSTLGFDYGSGKLTYSDKLKVAEDSITVNLDPYALAFYDARHLMASDKKTRYQEEALHTVKAVEAMHAAGRAATVDEHYIAMFKDTPHPESLHIGSVTLEESQEHGAGGGAQSRGGKSTKPTQRAGDWSEAV